MWGWKAVGIPPSRVSVICLICASQPCEGMDIGYVAKSTRRPFLIRSEREDAAFPSKDKNSHIMKDKVLG